MSDIPTSVSQSSINLFGVEMIVHQLDDGRRVIASESLDDLFSAMSDPTLDRPNIDELLRFAKTFYGVE